LNYIAWLAGLASLKILKVIPPEQQVVGEQNKTLLICFKFSKYSMYFINPSIYSIQGGHEVGNYVLPTILGVILARVQGIFVKI
jgi:hypothetical protein